MSRGPIHRIDPSRTGTLRRKLELEFMRRFDKLMRMINDLVVSRDAFGIAVANSVDAGRGDNRGGIVAQNDRFTFATDSEKLNQFSQWLATQVSTEIITIGFGQPTDDAFWTQYIWQAYQKGMERAFDDLNKAKRFRGGVADFYAGTKQEFLQQSFGHPVSIERVKQLSSRVLTELEGVTAAMETQMKRELLDGLTQGLSPKQVARNINDRVEKIGKTRARAIAQSELMRSHSEGQLDSMERQGVDEIGIMVEWSTSGLGTTALGNPSPCKVCAPLEGIVLKVSEARGMLPRHVACRCVWTPANLGEPSVGVAKRVYDEKTGKVVIRKTRQKKTKEQIERQLAKSLEASGGKKKSRWQGADAKISKKRPKSPTGR